VLVTRPTMYTFALEANTALSLRRIPSLTVGFVPQLKDKRLHLLDWLTTAAKHEIDAALKNTNRVFVVHSLVDTAGYRAYLDQLSAQIRASGFALQSQARIGTARVSVWERRGAGSSPGG